MTTRSTTPRLSERSNAEILLGAQLEQAGIPFEREYQFARHLGRKWRADFVIFTALRTERLESGDTVTHRTPVYLVEVDGGAFIGGRHSRGTGVEADCEKQSAAAILGYRVIRCTPAQVNDGRALSWIKRALA